VLDWLESVISLPPNSAYVLVFVLLPHNLKFPTGGKVRFDWLSFVFGFISATIFLIVLQVFLARLRWKSLNTPLKHYAENLAHTEDSK
jgi:hypothetical protein